MLKKFVYSIFFLGLSLPTHAWANAYRSSPQVGTYTSNNVTITARIEDLDINADRVRFRMQANDGRRLNGGIVLIII